MTDSRRVLLAPGYRISPVINGCWQLTPDHGGGPGSPKAVMSRFAELVDNGFTTFDCADIYTGVERLLGRFRRSLPDPESIQVHTKLVPDRQTLPNLTAGQVDAVIDRSLRRLDTERLDLVQFHWWDMAVPGLDMLIERLLRACHAGKIGLLGATNFSAGQVDALLRQGVPLVSLQAQYSLLDRRPEKQMTGLCRQRDMGLLAYGVLAGGFLGEGLLGREPDKLANRSLVKYRLIIEEAGGWSAYQHLLKTLVAVGRKHAVPPELVAARWILDRPSVKAVILGIGRRSKVPVNLRLAGLQLDSEDREKIRNALGGLAIPAGDMYELERDTSGPHAAIIRTDLQQPPT